MAEKGNFRHKILLPSAWSIEMLWTVLLLVISKGVQLRDSKNPEVSCSPFPKSVDYSAHAFITIIKFFVCVFWQLSSIIIYISNHYYKYTKVLLPLLILQCSIYRAPERSREKCTEDRLRYETSSVDSFVHIVYTLWHVNSWPSTTTFIWFKFSTTIPWCFLKWCMSLARDLHFNPHPVHVSLPLKAFSFGCVLMKWRVSPLDNLQTFTLAGHCNCTSRCALPGIGYGW